MAGKDKIEKGLRFKFDDSGGTLRDLSSALLSGSFSNAGAEYEAVDMHGVSETIKTVLAGWGTANVTAKFHMDDTATTGAFTVLKNAPYNGTLTVQFGSNGAAPTTGDPTWGGEFALLSCAVAPESGRMVITATFQPQSGQAAPAWSTI